MTRRGTLVYYLAAWVIGCFVVAVLYWIRPGEPPDARDLLGIYFVSLIFGAVTILLFAFLLRRLMQLLKTHALPIWFLSGAALSFVEISASIRGYDFVGRIRWGRFADIIFSAMLGPGFALRGRDFWQVPIDGAVTAVVLCLVDRAFARSNQAAEPKHSPV